MKILESSMICPDDTVRRIRDRILHAMALNRTPGYHFAGNYFGTLFDTAATGETRVEIDAGVHCTDADGRISIGAIGLLADIAMGACMRAGMDHSTRLATSRIHLEFTGVAPTGNLEAASTFEGFFRGGSGKQGMTLVAIRQGADAVCHGSGAFMMMPVHSHAKLAPFPFRHRDDAPVLPLDVDELTHHEREIFQRAESLLAAPAPAGQDFISRFLGYDTCRTPDGASCMMMNGPHVGNRVGHMQGGILLGLAAATAEAALGKGWGLTDISACFLRPGVGKMMEAQSKIVHAGRLTAVTRTEVWSSGKLLLEATTSHALLAQTRSADLP